MIRFELNDTSYAVTNDAMATMVRIMAEDWSRDYDIVEHNESGKRTDAWLWVHPVEDADAPDENPIRHWITPEEWPAWTGTPDTQKDNSNDN
jgi:hypothetical protein